METARRILAGTCLLLALSGSVAGEEFWIAPDGADSAPGTRDRPFATPARAMQAVREVVARGPESDMLVHVAPGRYELSEPLRFGPADGGDQRFSVTWRADNVEPTIFSGGRRVASWRRRSDGVWAAPLPEGTSASHLRSLFVAGRRSTRARSPRVDAKRPYLRVTEVVLDEDKRPVGVGVDPVDLPEGSLAGAEIVLLTSWASMRRTVESVDRRTGEVRLAPPHLRRFRSLMPRRGQACYFDRLSRVPREAGEWSIDRASGEILYRPRPGERMDELEAIVSVLTELLVVEGAPGEPVRRLHFRGLAFHHAAWSLPPEGYLGRQAGFRDLRALGDGDGDDPYWPALARPPAAVRLRYAEDCSIPGCDISHVDAAGIDLGAGCRRSRVEGCAVFDVGSTGILEGLNLLPHYLPAGAGPPADDVTRGNRIVGSRIRGCGVECPGAVGIWSAGQGVLIARNLVHDLPYTGISLGWMWDDRPTVCFGNTVGDNIIHAVGKVLPEAAGIYVLGRQNGTMLRGNAVWDVRFNAAAHDRPHWGLNKGIHLDQGSAEIRIEGNAVHSRGEVTVPIHFHRVRDIVVRGNTFASPGARTPWRFARCDETDVRLADNRVVDSEKTPPPGPVPSDSDAPLPNPTGGP